MPRSGQLDYCETKHGIIVNQNMGLEPVQALAADASHRDRPVTRGVASVYDHSVICVEPSVYR